LFKGLDCHLENQSSRSAASPADVSAIDAFSSAQPPGAGGKSDVNDVLEGR
jgi:hypothetical protein